MEPAEPLFCVPVRIALCVEVNTVTAIERSFTVWHSRFLDNEKDMRPPLGVKIERAWHVQVFPG
jgi:hypothetical protein